MSSEEGDKPGKEKKNNVLPLWGNERSMNLNPLILTNIQSSHYFKVNLYELKTYHEVIDEIYYKVSHLEPWEKGSRKTAGQTGMCGGVRGVGAGGIVSTAYCLLYKLFTLKLTRKQINGLLTHPDSPYIRALGFMYIRYTQPPPDLWDWYDAYLQDPEEMDVKAGGGHVMTIGNMLHHFLTKLEWFSTLFPRIPVPIQQKLARQLSTRFPQLPPVAAPAPAQPPNTRPAVRSRDDTENFGEAERVAKLRRSDGEGRSPSLGQGRSPRDSPSHVRDRERERKGSPRDSPSNYREREREKSRDSPSNHREREKRDSPHIRDREREREKRGSSWDSPSNHRERERRDSPSNHRERERDKRVSPRDSPPNYRERERSPPQPHHREREREKSPSHHRGEKRSSRGSSPVRKHRRNSHDRHPEQAEHVSRRDHEPDYRHERHDREEFRHRNRGDRSNGHTRDKERHHRSHRNEEHSSSRHRSSHGKDFASELAREKDRQEKRDRSDDRTSSRHSPSSRRS